MYVLTVANMLEMVSMHMYAPTAATAGLSFCHHHTHVVPKYTPPMVSTAARDATKADAPAAEGRPQLEVSTSDAGITTSVTGNSSPVTERTEDESALADSGISENRRTLAERLLPKPRKTGVEE